MSAGNEKQAEAHLPPECYRYAIDAGRVYQDEVCLDIEVPELPPFEVIEEAEGDGDDYDRGGSGYSV